MKSVCNRLVGAALGSLLLASTVSATTLDVVKEKGYVNAGVSGKVIGFSAPDSQGVWRGMDVDFVRAVASAIFDDPNKARFTPVAFKEAFAALQSGEIEILARNTTWTFQRDTKLGLEFVGPLFYDGQGFLVHKDLGVKSALELDGASVCTQSGTTTELNMADYFASHGMTYLPVVYESADEATVIYDTGRCDVYTTDSSALAARRTILSNPDDHEILPEIISKEPLGPAVRQGDQQWSDLVRWTLFALITGEELGITSENVDQMLTSENTEVKRFLGVDSDFGQHIGLSHDWAYRIIKHVGNYSEVFERNVGSQTALGLDRGLNALWTNGGLMYAPPIR
ncbi:amino acid ABC transporter substrate-binding protein [Desulfotalea psychrophila]|uniref:Probable amino acid ABC transporter, periplasmic substrate-binding protein n=1 Tax=Desulfotalea psychrophila (strain LSv54 / DSM 12343) TaxID=177439 RepID=Q6ANB1_DESPS|nr:amino acid ABC transporter substrate-binding protein [Desulfotalea psychrophila]CAG36163.1 probable amino acid ABC transporter, periplasmic substrate-binding protein [Desulfotalea psychrophila LSv54]